MNPTDIRATIREFLDLLESGRGSEYENWRQLGRSLDALCWAYHCAAEYAELDDAAPDRPSVPFMDEYMRFRGLAARRFPAFGYYNEPDPVTLDIAEPKPLAVGDAIDDLAEILHELTGVEWYWENTSEANALYVFRMQMAYHTLDHIRGLQRFLIAHANEQHPEWSGVY